MKRRIKPSGKSSTQVYVLWLNPEYNGETYEMRKSLSSVFPKYFNPQREFRKHLTVGFFQSEGELFKAKKVLDGNLGTVEFFTSRISYMLIDKSEKFSEANHIDL